MKVTVVFGNQSYAAKHDLTTTMQHLVLLPSIFIEYSDLNRSFKRLVRFSVDHQFSAHTPLLVKTPVNSFEFEPYDRSSPAEYLTR